MNVTKYEDLNRKLAESEKSLCDKISEDCASSFRVAIDDSIQKIKENTVSMSELVKVVQTCKDDYSEVVELVKNLNSTLSDTDKKIVELNEGLDKLSEKRSKLSEKESVLLKLSDEFVTKGKENKDAINETCKAIQNLGSEYSGSIEDAIVALKNLVAEFGSTEKKITESTNRISENVDSLSSNAKICASDMQSCVDELKRSTDEYVKTVQVAKDSLLDSIDVFKGDYMTTSSEQLHLINEIKAEQLWQKKICLLGLIPGIIIIILQIVNIVS